MWHTFEGVRSLRHAERELFLRCACVLRDRIAEGDDADEVVDRGTGVALFERLTDGEKMFAVAIVLLRLLDDSEPIPSYAWMDAAVYAVLQVARTEAEAESALPAEARTIRRLLKRCLRVRRVARKSQWGGMVEDVADRILWDRDFENEAHFLDMPPELAATGQANLGIQRDYYSTPVPFASAEVVRKSDAIIRLLGGYPLPTR